MSTPKGLLSTDCWSLVARRLRITDLCVLVQVSRSWYHFWSSDAMWKYQKQRICTRFHELSELFDHKRKRQKTESLNIINQVFLTIIRQSCNEIQLSQLGGSCVRTILKTILLINVPCPEYIEKIDKYTVQTRFGDTIGLYYNGICKMHQMYFRNNNISYLHDIIIKKDISLIQVWRAYILELPYNTSWTKMFENLIKRGPL